MGHSIFHYCTVALEKVQQTVWEGDSALLFHGSRPDDTLNRTQRGTCRGIYPSFFSFALDLAPISLTVLKAMHRTNV